MTSSRLSSVQFRFYEELNDFLPREKRKTAFTFYYKGNPSIKDSIEAAGVPHTEVDLIVVNGESVGFDYHLRDGDYIAVYPVFEGIDISPIVKLRAEPLRRSSFVCDVHLGKCAALLRMLGFDTIYRNDYDDSAIVHISVKQGRIILTRDRRMLHIRDVTHGYCVRSQKPAEQAGEVIRRFDLHKQIKPFIRCMACNGIIKPVEKQDILTQLEPKTARYYNEFYRCESCNRVYWKGSHYEAMKNTLNRFINT